MTMEEFNRATDIMEEFYNKKFNDTQIEIWFDELKYYSAEKYEKAVRYLCKTSQYRPTLNAVIEATTKAKLNNNLKQKVECNLCRGTGYYLYKKEIDGQLYDYACLCNCENAEGLEYDGTKIADVEHRSPYYLKRLDEVFADLAVNGGEVNV